MSQHIGFVEHLDAQQALRVLRTHKYPVRDAFAGPGRLCGRSVVSIRSFEVVEPAALREYAQVLDHHGLLISAR